MTAVSVSSAPLTPAQLAARLAALDSATLAAVLAAALTPTTTPGVAALLAPTLQGAREALQISFPSPTERFLRQLLI